MTSKESADMTTPAGAERICAVGDCIAHPELAEPILLCGPHLLQVVAEAFPQVIRAAASVLPEPPEALRMMPAPVEQLLSARSHDPVTYFISNGERVKIGTTRNLRNRVSSLSLRPENVLLVVYGGVDVERELHAKFRDLRVGNTEWFRNAGGLRLFIHAETSSTSGAAAQVSARRFSKPSGLDARREIVFSLVADAGPGGIGPEEITRRIRSRFPDIEPPHQATIGRWLSADARVAKPAYGRYAAVSA